MEENELIDTELTPTKRSRVFLIAGLIGLLFLGIELFSTVMEWYLFSEYTATMPGIRLKPHPFPLEHLLIVLPLLPCWIGIIKAKKWAYFGILAILFGRILLAFLGIRMNILIYPAYEILALIVLSYRLHEMKR